MQILWHLQKLYFEFPSIPACLDSDQLQTLSLVIVLHSICSAFSEKYNDPNCYGQKDNF